MKLRTLAPLCLLLLAATASAETVVYDLETKNAANPKQIADALGRVLIAQCSAPPVSNPGACKVELLQTGQVLVEAPPASQAQVAAVLKAIAARNAAPTARVTLQYWVIYGAPGKASTADPALKPLSAVVQQLERTHGDLAFSVLDTTSLMTQSGSSGGAHGGSLNVDQTIRVSGDDLDLLGRLEFAPKPLLPDLSVKLTVSVTIKRGEFVVLGEQSAVEVVGGQPGKDEQLDIRQKSGMLFFVVHWQ
jgi:hypothetical protein